ncbi:DUF6959 family protein [Pseudoxanthomonas beigongshangi]
MYEAQVEIYSDRTNAVVLRHPGRKRPGVLVQGDTLFNLFQHADVVCEAARGRLTEDAQRELVELRDALLAYLDHYRTVLSEHGMEPPFHEIAGSRHEN